MGVVPPSSTADSPARSGRGQRQHILSVALTLMAQHGVAGTSMRDLAAATGLNVATLYHYFPSKRELLVAVLEEQGFVDSLAATPAVAAPAVTAPAVTAAGSAVTTSGGSNTSLVRDPALGLADLLADMLASMLQVEDFIRLMLGEALRGDETALTVGVDLFTATQESIERWLEESRPDLGDPTERAAMARALRAMVVGYFFEHVAGVLFDNSTDQEEALRSLAAASAAFFEHAPGKD